MLTLDWVEGEAFYAVDDSGKAVTLDGNGRKGLSPMQSLLTSLAACMAIDVVLILKKMRRDPERLRVEIDGARMDEPPRYFRSIRIRFLVQGNVSVEKARRAVALARGKYCSVFHTLRNDLDLETDVEVVGP